MHVPCNNRVNIWRRANVTVGISFHVGVWRSMMQGMNTYLWHLKHKEMTNIIHEGTKRWQISLISFMEEELIKECPSYLTGKYGDYDNKEDWCFQLISSRLGIFQTYKNFADESQVIKHKVCISAFSLW